MKAVALGRSRSLGTKRAAEGNAACLLSIEAAIEHFSEPRRATARSQSERTSGASERAMRKDDPAALDRRAAGQQLYFYGILPLASSKKGRVSRFLWKSKQPIPSRESIEFFCMDSWKAKIEIRKSGTTADSWEAKLENRESKIGGANRSHWPAWIGPGLDLLGLTSPAIRNGRGCRHRGATLSFHNLGGGASIPTQRSSLRGHPRPSLCYTAFSAVSQSLDHFTRRRRDQRTSKVNVAKTLSQSASSPGAGGWDCVVAGPISIREGAGPVSMRNGAGTMWSTRTNHAPERSRRNSASPRASELCDRA